MTINEAITLYQAAKAEQAAADKASKAAKARADEAAAVIMRHAGGRPSFSTDLFAVAITESVSWLLDGARLEKDFPGIKSPEQYGKPSPRTKIVAVPLAAADGRTA